MPEHPCHQTIGKLVEGLGLTPNQGIWLDPACGGKEVVPLSNGTGSDGVCFCQVDILMLGHDRLVVIEIEESDVKPLHLFGKFYASAFSTHFNGQDIRKMPLLFIQVLDTSRVNLEKGEKGKQWGRIEGILKGRAKEWPGRQILYELLWGREAEFKAEATKGRELQRTVGRFLRSPRGSRRTS